MAAISSNGQHYRTSTIEDPPPPPPQAPLMMSMGGGGGGGGKEVRLAGGPETFPPHFPGEESEVTPDYLVN